MYNCERASIFHNVSIFQGLLNESKISVLCVDYKLSFHFFVSSQLSKVISTIQLEKKFLMSKKITLRYLYSKHFEGKGKFSQNQSSTLRA